MRSFQTGSTRDDIEGKPDYAGYFDPEVIVGFGKYMLKHQIQADGKPRASDNWKKGMDKSVWFSSLFRHFVDLWLFHEEKQGRETIEDAMAGMLFNLQGYWREYIKNGRDQKEK